MKKYSTGLITGICFTISAFVFMGANQYGSSDIVAISNGQRFSYRIIEKDQIIMFDHQEGGVAAFSHHFLEIVDDSDFIVASIDLRPGLKNGMADKGFAKETIKAFETQIKTTTKKVGNN